MASYQLLVAALCGLVGIGIASLVPLTRKWAAEGLLASAVGCLVLARPFSLLVMSLTHRTNASAWVELERMGPFGESSLSAAVVGGAVLSIWCRLRRQDWSRTAVWGVAIGAFGYALQKVTCFWQGCCFGKATFGWWAVQLPERADATARSLAPFVHPVQLYDAGASLAVFIALLVSLKRRDPLLRAALGTAALGMIRIALEPLRYAYAQASTVGGIPGLTENALVCLAVILACAGVVFFRSRFRRDGRPIE